MDEYSQDFNRMIGNIKKKRSELKNAITELKNTLEGINNRLDDERIGGLEDNCNQYISHNQNRKRKKEF